MNTTNRFSDHIMRIGGLLTALSFMLLCGGLPSPGAQPAEMPLAPPIESQNQKTPAHLYFSDNNQSFLSAETRVIVHADSAADFARQIVAALIRGPQSGLVQTLPANCQVRAFFLMPDGTAVVDFSGTLSSQHPGGCRAEMLTIYSIVNSLVLNVPDIDAVQILIEGVPAATLAGHVDIRRALQADMMLIR